MKIGGIEIDVPPELDSQSGSFGPYLKIAEKANDPEQGLFVSLRVYPGQVPNLKNPAEVLSVIGVWLRIRAYGDWPAFHGIDYDESKEHGPYKKVKKFFPLSPTDKGWAGAAKVAESEFIPELTAAFRAAVKADGGKVLLRGTKLDTFFMQVVEMMPLQAHRAKVYSPVTFGPDHTTFGPKHVPLEGQMMSAHKMQDQETPKPAMNYGEDDPEHSPD
jgi:hypothetical protein